MSNKMWVNKFFMEFKLKAWMKWYHGQVLLGCVDRHVIDCPSRAWPHFPQRSSVHKWMSFITMISIIIDLGWQIFTSGMAEFLLFYVQNIYAIAILWRGIMSVRFELFALCVMRKFTIDFLVYSGMQNTTVFVKVGLKTRPCVMFYMMIFTVTILSVTIMFFILNFKEHEWLTYLYIKYCKV